MYVHIRDWLLQKDTSIALTLDTPEKWPVQAPLEIYNILSRWALFPIWRQWNAMTKTRFGSNDDVAEYNYLEV